MAKCTIFSVCESMRDVYPSPKNYETHSIRLAKSIRKNGGECKDLPIKMWYGDDAPPSPETTKKLIDLGCDVVPGKCIYHKYPLFNKISACDMNFDTDYAMWMDSDLYVLGDFSEILDYTKDLAMSPNQASHHKWARLEDKPAWKKIYKTLNADFPTTQIINHIDGKPGHFYFCSGMFMFKTGIGFPKMYHDCAADILGMGGDFTLNFTQTGLGAAVHVGEYSYSLIPEKYHYFYVLHDKKLAPDTKIVHYQDNIVTEVPTEEWNVI